MEWLRSQLRFPTKSTGQLIYYKRVEGLCGDHSHAIDAADPTGYNAAWPVLSKQDSLLATGIRYLGVDCQHSGREQ